MELSEELERAGHWLFRWRGQLPWAMVAGYVLATYSLPPPSEAAELDEAWELFCLAISMLGLGIRVLTVGYVPKGTSGRNTRTQVADSLNTAGMYSIVRHPLYLGNFFMGLGPAAFSHIGWLVLVYVLVFALYYERIVLAEEAFLGAKFGVEYRRWASRTPAFIPRLRRFRRPSLGFSVRAVLRREYNGLFAAIVAFFVLKVSNDAIVERSLEADPMWTAILAIGVLTWISLRSFKKRTKLLDIDGR